MKSYYRIVCASNLLLFLASFTLFTLCSLVNADRPGSSGCSAACVQQQDSGDVDDNFLQLTGNEETESESDTDMNCSGVLLTFADLRTQNGNVVAIRQRNCPVSSLQKNPVYLLLSTFRI